MLDFVRTPDLNPTNVGSSVDYYSFGVTVTRRVIEIIWGPLEASLQSVDRTIFDDLYSRETK